MGRLRVEKRVAPFGTQFNLIVVWRGVHDGVKYRLQHWPLLTVCLVEETFRARIAPRGGAVRTAGARRVGAASSHLAVDNPVPTRYPVVTGRFCMIVRCPQGH